MNQGSVLGLLLFNVDQLISSVKAIIVRLTVTIIRIIIDLMLNF